MIRSHHHVWKWKERGTGRYQKGKQQVEFETEGFKAECKCGKWMFFPDQINLRPVEIEKETS